MRYLVTGGGGFIGSALVRRLAGDGHEVTVYDDFSRGRMSRLHGVNCHITSGDVRDAGWLARSVQGQDAVIHLAYLQGTQTFYANPKTVLDVAARGMLNLLAACEKWGVTDFLLVSSSEAYQVATVVPTPETVPCSVPDPLNPRYSYGGGKIFSEIMGNAWAREGILDRFIIARPHNIYGPDMGREHVIPQFCQRMNELAADCPGEPVLDFPIQGTGQETRSFCYIADCIEQLSLLLGKAPEGQHIYHVGQMEEKTIAEVASSIAGCYSRLVKIVPGTLPKGSPPRRLPDIAKLQALAGAGTWRHTPWATGISETVEWYKQHG